MKRLKLLFTSIGVVAVIGSALAFRTAGAFGQGSVFCANTCATNTRADFRINPAGTSINPCGTTGGVENQAWAYCSDGSCIQVAKGLKYDAVAAGK